MSTNSNGAKSSDKKKVRSFIEQWGDKFPVRYPLDRDIVATLSSGGITVPESLVAEVRREMAEEKRQQRERACEVQERLEKKAIAAAKVIAAAIEQLEEDDMYPLHIVHFLFDEVENLSPKYRQHAQGIVTNMDEGCRGMKSPEEVAELERRAAWNADYKARGGRDLTPSD